MTPEEILQLPATISRNNALGLVRELFENTEGWHVYSDFVQHGDDIIRKFLQLHARLPGILAPVMQAYKPLHVFEARNPDDGSWIKGGVFQNGVFFRMQDGGSHHMDFLWVHPETAEFWNYPPPINEHTLKEKE